MAPLCGAQRNMSSTMLLAWITSWCISRITNCKWYMCSQQYLAITFTLHTVCVQCMIYVRCKCSVQRKELVWPLSSTVRKIDAGLGNGAHPTFSAVLQLAFSFYGIIKVHFLEKIIILTLWVHSLRQIFSAYLHKKTYIYRTQTCRYE